MERNTALKEVLTTGQVARICNVTIRTVIKWFESGKLDGYKIPDSKDRRIPREKLRLFLREHNIPFDGQLFEVRPRLLVADDDPVILQNLEQFFSKNDEIDVHTAANGYEAGFLTSKVQPDVLLIDYNLGDTTATEVLETLSKDNRLQNTRVLIMTGYLDDAEIKKLEDVGLRVFKKPFDHQELEKEVLELLQV